MLPSAKSYYPGITRRCPTLGPADALQRQSRSQRPSRLRRPSRPRRSNRSPRSNRFVESRDDRRKRRQRARGQVKNSGALPSQSEVTSAHHFLRKLAFRTPPTRAQLESSKFSTVHPKPNAQTRVHGPELQLSTESKTS